MATRNCLCRFHMNRVVRTRLFRRQLSSCGMASAVVLPKLKLMKKKGWLEPGRRHSGFLVSAELPSFSSVDIGLDYQSDSFYLPGAGPLPGDIVEVEAYCRIFRATEQFHKALLDALCNPVTGGCSVLYDVPLEDKLLLEKKILSVLGCMVCLLNKGREDVLEGRSSITNSFPDLDKSEMDDKLPPLAKFRYEMESYCESLHVALENYLMPGNDRSLHVWRKFQRLKNVCYDSGFPRGDGHPCQTLLANWSAVYFSTSKEEAQSAMAVAFWKGGQVTEESLNWLLEKGFRTIIDLRAETVKDRFYESVLCKAISSGKVELINIPVEVGTTPSDEQIEQFSALVSDSSKGLIYVHSKEGNQRISSMVSRWRQYIDSIASAKMRVIASDVETQDTQELEDSDSIKNFEEGESSNKSSNESYQTPMAFPNKGNNGASYGKSKENGSVKTSTDLSKNPISIDSDLSSDDENLEIIGQNMCDSATDVVRVQSRKKAEIFLVRTDGFLCIREKVTESSLAFTHPITQQQMLVWESTPKTVLLIKKLGLQLMEEAKEVASFLYQQEKMNVLVEPEVHDVFARIPGFEFVQTYSQETSDLHERVDFVACLGGDGVILHASNLFRAAVPPIISFDLGSLGFLTSHTFDDYKGDLRQVIHANGAIDHVYITLRMRLCCEIFRNGKAVPGKKFYVLNEIVVDRGSNLCLSMIECYERDRLITKVQGDGVIVATPTGSTAYSTAAGGSMVHPNVPCMLFTPICPHSLSFRPVILPDSAQLELKIPEDARSNAWVSFDGKRRHQLLSGDSVRISVSRSPLPTVNKGDQTGDWFRSLVRCLNWNQRLDQKTL